MTEAERVVERESVLAIQNGVCYAIKLPTARKEHKAELFRDRTGRGCTAGGSAQASCSVSFDFVYLCIWFIPRFVFGFDVSSSLRLVCYTDGMAKYWHW